MDNTTTLKQDIKQLMVENLMLQSKAEEIADDLPLFGPGSLVWILSMPSKLVVALDKNYGLKIPDPERPKKSCRVSTPSWRRWNNICRLTALKLGEITPSHL